MRACVRACVRVCVCVCVCVKYTAFAETINEYKLKIGWNDLGATTRLVSGLFLLTITGNTS